MKRVLVAPLDWGLGHTSRCIPIIEELQAQQAHVIFAGNNAQQSFVRAHFKNISCIPLEGYNVSYSAIWPQWIKVGFQSIRLVKTIEREHEWLNKIITKEKIDIVISDNRYGLYSSQCKSIFITHQLAIPSPIFKRTVNTINANYIKKFDECWIPDDDAIELSGELSKSDIHSKRIGLLSRFKKKADSLNCEFDFLFFLSGNEPQRSILEKKLLTIASVSNYSIALIRGRNELLSTIPENVQQFGLLNSQELEEVIYQSGIIICRSGYSSIMDLTILQKKLFLIPTPGQPEQEYLAAYLNKRYEIPYGTQSDIHSTFNLEDLRGQARSIEYYTNKTSARNKPDNEHLLRKEISRILSA